MSARSQGLQIEIEDGRLVISIGIDALMIAVAAGYDWPIDEFRVTDADAFAQGIVRGLEAEAEDGTTRVHIAIDGAAMWALETGEPGVDQIPPGPEEDGEEEA